MSTNKKVWRNFRLLVFYAIQLAVFYNLTFMFFPFKNAYQLLVGYELVSIQFYLFRGFYKYSVNFYEAFIETTWAKKGTWFSTIDMLISILEIGVKFSLLLLFMAFYNYPVSFARDILNSISNCVKNVKGWFKGRRLIRRVKKFRTVKLDRNEDESCGICLLSLEKGKMLPCGHIFHESCLV